MGEQTLAALGVVTCGDLVAQRGLLGALYSSVSTDYFMAVRTSCLTAGPQCAYLQTKSSTGVHFLHRPAVSR